MHLKRLWLVKMKYENDIDKSFGDSDDCFIWEVNDTSLKFPRTCNMIVFSHKNRLVKLDIDSLHHLFIDIVHNIWYIPVLDTSPLYHILNLYSLKFKRLYSIYIIVIHM